MIIDWLKYANKEHVLAWFLTEAMSSGGDITKKFGDFNSQELEVKLTINGVEVPLEEPMNFLQKQLGDIAENGEMVGREKLYRRMLANFDEIMEDLGGE